MAEKEEVAAEEQNEQHPDSPNARREKLVEGLARSRPWADPAEEDQLEMSDLDDEEIDEAEAAGEEEAEGEPSADEGEEKAVEAPASKPEFHEPPDDFMVTVRVNGQEQQMRYGDMKRSVQIESAARERLEEANRLLAEAERGKRMPRGRSEDDKEDFDDVGEERETEIDYQALAKSLQYDDPEVAAEAIKNVVTQISRQGQQGGTVDQEQLRQQIAADLQNQMEWQQAVARFGEDYQDILADQRLATLAGNEINATIQQAIWDSQQTGNPRPAFWDIFNSVGDNIRGWNNSLRGAAQAEDSGESEPSTGVGVNVDEAGRQTRKVRASNSTPRPRSRQRSGGTSDQPVNIVETRRSAIEDMMRQRGQLTEES